MPVEQAPAPDPRRWRALWVTQLAGAMSLLDVSIVNVALPSIHRDLDTTMATAQWVISGYALAFGLALVPGGRLGDAFGRRRMFLIALTAFIATSALSGAAPSAEWLVVARLLQGVAGGMLVPQNSGLIQDLFRGAERGRAFGILGATVGLATATGPVAGGLILAATGGADGWRWVFYVNVPIGLVTLFLAARLVPQSTFRAPHVDLDVVGALLLGSAVFCVLLPLVEAETGGLAQLWWLLLAAVPLLAAFAWWELRTLRTERQPLLDPRLVRTPGYAFGLSIGLMYFIGFTGIWLVLAMFFQNGLGYSPLRSGLAVSPFALGSAAAALVAGRLVPRLGRWLTVAGLTVVTAGIVTSALVLRHSSGDTATWLAAVPLLLAGLGGGMVVAPNTTLTLASVPVVMAGAAGGALQTGQRVGSAVGTAVLATVFFQVLSRGGGYEVAVSDALLCAAGFMLLALLLAVVDLNRNRGGPAVPTHAPAPREARQ